MPSYRIFSRIVLSVLIVCLLSFAQAKPVGAADNSKDISTQWITDVSQAPVDTAKTIERGFQDIILTLADVPRTLSRLTFFHTDSEKSSNHSQQNHTLGSGELAMDKGISISELLGTLSIINKTDDIGLGHAARVDIRGFGGEAKQALVLLDGVRAVEPFDNSVTWHLYPKNFLKSVEINTGGSAILGEGALSGSILLQTKDPTEAFHYSTENAFSSFQGHDHFVEMSGTYQKMGYYAAAQYATDEGYRQNAFYEGSHFLLKNEINFSEVASIKNTLFFVDAKSGIAGPLLDYEAQSNRRQKDPDGQFGDGFDDKLFQDSFQVSLYLESLDVELTNLSSLRLRDQLSEQSFGGFFAGTSINGIETETFSNVFQASWQQDYRMIHSRMTTGLEWSIDDIYNPSSFVSFLFGPFDAEKALDRRMLGFFAQEQLSLGDKLTVDMGIRADKIDWDIYDLKTPSAQQRKDADNISPSFGVSFEPYEQWVVYGRYSEAFKVPDANALIFATPNIFSPNPNVDSQIARHYEAGLQKDIAHSGYARAGVFFIETKKEILFNDITNLNENFDTHRNGVEFEGRYQVWPGVILGSAYVYTQAQFDNGAFDENDIPLVPRHKITGDIFWRLSERLSMSLNGQILRQQYTLNDFNNLFILENYEVLSGNITYEQGSWEIFGNFTNLLGDAHSSFETSNAVDTVNVNPLPRWTYRVGFRAKF